MRFYFYLARHQTVFIYYCYKHQKLKLPLFLIFISPVGLEFPQRLFIKHCFNMVPLWMTRVECSQFLVKPQLYSFLEEHFYQKNRIFWAYFKMLIFPFLLPKPLRVFFSELLYSSSLRGKTPESVSPLKTDPNWSF